MTDPDLHELQTLLRAAAPAPSADAAERLDARVRNARDAAGRAHRGTRRGARAWTHVRGLARGRTLVLAPLGALTVAFAVVFALAGAPVERTGSTGEGRLTAPWPATAERAAGPDAGADTDAARSDSVAGMTKPQDMIAPVPAPDAAVDPSAPRKVTRDATLDVAVADVSRAAQDAMAITDDAGGVVLDAQLQTGPAVGADHAQLSLAVPAGRLTDTLGRLSALGVVQARTQRLTDVTASFDDLREQLDTLRGRRASLIADLRDADDSITRQQLRAQLDDVGAQIDAVDRQLKDADARTKMAPISLTLTPRPGATHSATPSEPGGFGVAQAFDRSVRALDVIGGALLLAAIVCAPALALAGVGWGLVAWRRRRRRRAARSDAD